MVTIRVKCTTCQKVQDASEKQIADAREDGCVFSTCCQAVATVEEARAEVQRGRICQTCYATVIGQKRICPQCGAQLTGRSFQLL